MAFPTTLVWMAIIAVSIQVFCKIIFNVALHPLRKYPGPWACHAVELYRIYKFMTGRLPHWLKDLHDTYGAVVRIGPNELSFIDSSAWKDIYTVQDKTSEMAKYNKFYGFMGSRMADNILNASFLEHIRLRSKLAPSFSTRSLQLQEPVLRKYSSLLIQRLQAETEQADKDVNLRDWFTYFTFDLIGFLTFGSDFNCLQSSKYHPWVAALTKNLKEYRWIQFCMYLGLDQFVHLVANSKVLRAKALHEHLTMDKLRSALLPGAKRSGLLKALLELEVPGLPFDKLHSNMCLLIIAGSETNATLLVSVASILAEHPEHQRMVAQEVRTTFAAEDEITMSSVNCLTYLLACIDETMRLFPPAAIGGPRITPRGGAIIAGHAVVQNTVVSVAQWAAYHSPTQFAQPDEFHPERWLKDPPLLFRKDNLEVFRPFSVGHRDCIARNLAYVESRLVLARIMWNFNIKIRDSSKGWREKQHSYLLWDKKDLYVKLEPAR